MSNILIHDLHDAKELDSGSMVNVRGGWFGAILSAMASHSASGDGGTNPSPGHSNSDILIMKTTDQSSAKLF
jgi:hypothetical protein